MTETDDPNGKLSLTEIVNNLVTKSWHYEHKFFNSVCYTNTFVRKKKEGIASLSKNHSMKSWPRGPYFTWGMGKKEHLDWSGENRHVTAQA